MELFTPELGLVFWMFVTFVILFAILAKFAWPAIVKMLEERADLIDKGVVYAQNAKEQLDNAKSEAASYIAEARKQQAEILREADKMKTQIIEEAKAAATVEAKKVMEAANLAIEQARKASEKQLRQEVSAFALGIAEKVVSSSLSKPGRYAIDRDMFTIYDAIGAAGDLTIYGKRDAVKVMRGENGEQKVYTVDLCNAASVAQSPVYCLRQGDMVYVAPNNMRARQSTVNGNNVLSTSFWISLASLLTTVCVLVFK